MIESEVVELAHAFAELHDEKYLRSSQIILFDKHNHIDEDKCFKILHLPLRNTSGFSVSHPIFDSHQVAQKFLSQYPKFNKFYMHNGVFT